MHNKEVSAHHCNVSRRRALLLGMASVVYCNVPIIRSLAAVDLKAIHFDVIRNNEVIGRHDVIFTSVGNDGFNVETTIDIEVRILGVRVFIYQHKGTEQWRAGRLFAFDSRTIDNDSKFFVVGRARDDGFHITNRKGEVMAPADIMVGSYWRPEIALEKRLIDPQRGRIKDQRLITQDQLDVRIGGVERPTERYSVTGVVEGWVAYDAKERWVAATLRKAGSDILYRLRS